MADFEISLERGDYASDRKLVEKIRGAVAAAAQGGQGADAGFFSGIVKVAAWSGIEKLSGAKKPRKSARAKAASAKKAPAKKAAKANPAAKTARKKATGKKAAPKKAAPKKATAKKATAKKATGRKPAAKKGPAKRGPRKGKK